MALHALMERLVKLALVVDVKAGQAVNQKTVDALVDGFGGLCTRFSSFILNHKVKVRCMPL